MNIKKPLYVKVGNSSVRVFGSRENHDFWTKTRRLKASDLLTPNDLKALRDANVSLSNTNHSHPVSDKKNKRIFDLRNFIRKIFTKREK